AFLAEREQEVQAAKATVVEARRRGRELVLRFDPAAKAAKLKADQGHRSLVRSLLTKEPWEIRALYPTSPDLWRDVEAERVRFHQHGDMLEAAIEEMKDREVAAR